MSSQCEQRQRMQQTADDRQNASDVIAKLERERQALEQEVLLNRKTREMEAKAKEQVR